MQSEDWIARQIDELCRFTAKFMFSADTIVFDRKLACGHTAATAERVFALLAAGNICGAEDLLYAHADTSDKSYLAFACDFYRRLNAMRDTALEAADFPREEVLAGLQNILRLFAVPVVDEV